ncbi:hypothetical protein [Streptomyces sp. NPDC058401]|uniref:hypothetical protein n=1 Tax=Streptomyces sp. NPDC058401 TaxID=3346480 RepID=UPI00364C7692
MAEHSRSPRLGTEPASGGFALSGHYQPGTPAACGEYGREARDVERAVHNHLRKTLGLGPHLDSSDMGAVGGWTETYDAELVSPPELVRLVGDAAERLGVGCKVSA